MKKALILLAACAMVAPAFANINATASLQNADNIDIFSPVGSFQTKIGIFHMTINSGAMPSGSTSPFYAFCCDLSQFVKNPQDYEFVDPATLPTPANPYQPMQAARAAKLNELFGEHWGELFDGATDATDRQAFQMAVWEIIYEDTNNAYDVTSGLLHATGLEAGVAARAAQFLSTINGVGSFVQLIGLKAVNDDSQDFVTPPVVPAPAAVALGALGLGLAGWVRKRAA